MRVISPDIDSMGEDYNSQLDLLNSLASNFDQYLGENEVPITDDSRPGDWEVNFTQGNYNYLVTLSPLIQEEISKDPISSSVIKRKKDVNNLMFSVRRWELGTDPEKEDAEGYKVWKLGSEDKSFMERTLENKINSFIQIVELELNEREALEQAA